MNRSTLYYIKIALIIYAGAWALSWIIQIYFPTSDKPNLYQKEIAVEDDEVKINHSFYSLENQETDRTIILIPDLFGGQQFLMPLARELQDSVNVIIPVYPQKTVENKSVSNSVEKRALWVDILADSLGLKDVHLLGHGSGGLIAIHIASGSMQDRYKSMVLLSSYGPQELQFLGNHLINRSLYSMLYPVVMFYKYLVPHMGWYHEQPVDIMFINTLIELDQRPVRNQLKEIQLPVHILQPIHDKYVSLPIAQENYRLIPQSSMFVVNGDHNTIKEHPQIWALQILTFLDIVDNEKGIDREGAAVSRLELLDEPFDADKFATISGWTLAIILLLLIVISLLSEDLACIAGGLLVASGIIDFWFAVVGCCLGVLGADIIIYFLGKWIGYPILQWIPFRWFIKKEDIIKAEQLYRMKGVEIIFATRFLPGTRLPIYLVSGIIRVKFTFFLLYFVLSMIIWAPLLVGVSALIGQPMISYLTTYQEYALWLIPLIFGVIYLLVKAFMLISTITGRRKVIVKVNRFRERYFNE